MKDKKSVLFCMSLCAIVFCTGCESDEINGTTTTPEASFTAMPTAFRADMDGGSGDIAITSLLDALPAGYAIASAPDWVTATATDGGLHLVFAENVNPTERNSVVVLEQDSSLARIEIAVSQRAVAFPAEVRTDAAVPPEVETLVSRNFMTGSMYGFSEKKDFCETTYWASNTESFLYEEDVQAYPTSSPVHFVYSDCVVNPQCNDGVNTTDRVTRGFVGFNRRSVREGMNPYMEVGTLTAVSVVKFSLSASTLEGRGMALYKSVDGSAWEPLGIFKPATVNKGEWFSVEAGGGSNLRFKFAPVGNSGYLRLHDIAIYSPAFDHDGSLYIDEHFRTWTREGYVSDGRMTASGVMYASSGVNNVKTYTGWVVTWLMDDFAANPADGNDAGSSTETSDVSTGFLALQSPIFFKCGGHTSFAHITSSELPSVSKVRFSVSYCKQNIQYTHGVSLWKKGRNDSDWTRVCLGVIDGTEQEKIEGRVFEAEINEEKVRLSICPQMPILPNGTDITHPAGYQPWDDALYDLVPDNTTGMTFHSRIHDLQVWSLKK